MVSDFVPIRHPLCVKLAWKRFARRKRTLFWNKKPARMSVKTYTCLHVGQLVCGTFKGEVRAIGRFWVFDGNGLVGHQLIDSRWFEKNPPTESGWKRRSKNRRSTGISRGNDRDVMSAFDFAPIHTPFDQHGFFCVWLRTRCRSLVVEGSVIRSWFFAKPLYSSDPRCSKKKCEARVN